MTEAELLAEVTALCDHLGLLWHHDPDSRRVGGMKGFPDLLIVGRTLLFAELKSADGAMSADQDLWDWALHRADQNRVLWRPSDWASGSIRRMLEALNA